MSGELLPGAGMAGATDGGTVIDGVELRIHRKLAAIFAADVAGYSRLMGLDEEGTTRKLSECRSVMDALIARYGGRIANTAGDSVLAEFSSSVEAVRCAIEVQEATRSLNRDETDDRRVLFRIGVNVGDVIRQGDDLLGDGVNVAARLESLAEPGGICISGEVFDQIEGKLTLNIVPLGAKRLKNIKRPVRTYRIGDASRAPARQAPARVRPLFIGVLAIAVVCIGAVVWWRHAERTSPPVGPGSGATVSAASATEAQRAALLATRTIANEANWENRRYLVVLSWGSSWEQSEREARILGGYLASINSKEENEFLFSLIAGDNRLWENQPDGQTFGPWIGVRQTPGSEEPSGGWVLSSGEPISYWNWSRGQPNNFNGNSDFARFHNYVHAPAPFWDDAPANSISRSYIVEIETDAP